MFHALMLMILVSMGGTGDPAAEAAQADRLAHEVTIIDTHIDVPYRMREKPDDISKRTETGDFDFDRARKGGLDAVFMSIYTPASLDQTGGSKALADSLIDPYSWPYIAVTEYSMHVKITTHCNISRKIRKVDNLLLSIGIQNK